jgi:hypothetical protein
MHPPDKRVREIHLSIKHLTGLQINSKFQRVSSICGFLGKEIADNFDEEWYSSQQNICMLTIIFLF